ncbi:hypothetical protein CDL12_02015 [Handroanthus impetiginosus]|uniref:Transposase (putative) gypsy type domain-containing protein n=1 Tax=Handroanthus impetiginosus TaxID=429701 RepID=A0A2G9I666_9LAMI|nr:hypothetical protein CDL12_02015 [Handroanthus impetiginosus]
MTKRCWVWQLRAWRGIGNRRRATRYQEELGPIGGRLGIGVREARGRPSSPSAGRGGQGANLQLASGVASVGADRESARCLGHEGVLTVEELSVLSFRVHFPVSCRYVLPSPRARASNPPRGHFTVFTAYFGAGFTIPPDPLLVDVVRAYGLCLNQLTPNSFMYFSGFRHRFEELELPLSVESFQRLFLLKKSGLFEKEFDVSILFPAGKKIDLSTVRSHLKEKAAQGASRSAEVFRASGEEGLRRDSAGQSHRKGKGLFCYGAKNTWGQDSHWDTYDSAFSFGQMKSVLNEADMGRLKAYPPDDALELLFVDLARAINIAAYWTQEANRAGEMEKRQALELEKAKEEALRAVHVVVLGDLEGALFLCAK